MQFPQVYHRSRSTVAFTFTELLVSMSIFLFVVAGVFLSHLIGLRLYEVTRTKLGATDDSRTVLALLSGEARTAKQLKIGTGSASSFTEVADGSIQQGGAIQLYATTNTNSFVRYFLDTSVGQLKRAVQTNGVTGSTRIVAEFLTNSAIFSYEDYGGTVLSTKPANPILGVKLQFNQVRNPFASTNNGARYEGYQLQTKITPRAD